MWSTPWPAAWAGRVRWTARSTSSCPPTDRVVLPADLPVEELRLIVPGPYGPAALEQPGGAGAVVIRTVETHGYRLRLVDFPAAFDRDGIYGQPDDAWRFGLLGRAALETLRVEARPVDLLHVHDWHAAAALVLRDRFYAGDPIVGRGHLASILTIHNLAYHGWVDRPDLVSLGLAPGDPVVAPDAAGIDLLWAGIERADLVNTVSPTFAAEALTPAVGFGLDPTLRWKAGQRDLDGRPRFFGILNGIDPAVWDPATDADLASGYDRNDPVGQGRLPGRPPRAGRLRSGRRRPGPRDDRPARPPEGLRPAGRGRATAARRGRPAGRPGQRRPRRWPSRSGPWPDGGPTGSS